MKLIILLFTLLTTSSLYASELSSELQELFLDCDRSSHQAEPQSLGVLTNRLDCLTKTKSLSRLGGQWLILKKSRWELQLHENRTQIKIATNPFAPANKSLLLIKRSEFNQLMQSNQIYRWLEYELFPQLLKRSYFSLEGSFYHHSALTSTHDPLRQYSRYSSQPESFQRMGGKRAIYRSLVKSDPQQGLFWRELFKIYSSLTPCNSNCLAIMEGKLIRSSLMLLGHQDLATSVHRSLNQKYGCEDAPSHFKHLGVDLNLLQKAHRGTNALLGQPLYFKSIDDSVLDSDPFIGMNGILRKISDKAVLDLISLGGLGAKSISSSLLERGGTIEDELHSLSGVSALIGKYWTLRREGKKSEADKLLDRPFFLESWFEPTFAGIFKLNLKDWVKKLYRKNPRTPYKLFSYRYFTPYYFNLVLSSIDRLPSIADIDHYELKSRPTYPEEHHHGGHYTTYELLHGISNILNF
jgi:hypothetical protein